MTPWFPPMILVSVLIVALIADRLIALRTPERGTFWARAFLVSAATLTILLFVGWLLQELDLRLWALGIHLMQDLLYPESASLYAVALALPLFLWALILFATAFSGIDDPASGRWLAGAIDLRGTRYWLLLMPVLPLSVLAIFALERIPTQSGQGYPAALWSLLVVAIVNLVFVAFSKGPTRQPAPPSAPRPELSLPSWPEALRARGIEVDTLRTYEASPADDAEADPGEYIRAELAARRIPRRLLAALLAEQGNRLIMAPDDCGQLEAIALAAERQITRSNRVTLIVVPEQARVFRQRLARWMPDVASVAPLDSETRADSPAFAWVTDAKTLSDRLIPHLESHPLLLARIGTLVWWDLHLYSGVLAANFWAISHRFQRLIERCGRGQLRHIAFMRSTAAAETQYTPFLNLSLPRMFPPQTQVVIGDGFARAARLHLLNLHASAVHEDDAQWRRVDTVLAAAKASVQAGWPTHAHIPPHLDAQVVEQWLAQRIGDRDLGGQLQPDGAQAGALLLQVDSEDVLALPEIVTQIGRAGPDLPLVHVGLVPAFGNPYVRRLLERLRDDPQLLSRYKRRMVAAEPQPGVIRRHLLLALNELPATLSGLNKTFRWEQTGEIARTLRQLAEQNQIVSQDVRYLVEEQQEDRLKVEVQYRSIPARDRIPPLTTIGTNLVDVFDPGQGSIMLIDPERVTIEAYPYRVFLHQGRRYRIRQWESTGAIGDSKGGMRIDCRRDDTSAKTWRIFSPRLSQTRSVAGRKDVQIVGSGLTRTLVTTDYQELISGCLQYVQDERTGSWVEGRHLRLPAMIRSPVLSTSGLLLVVPRERVAGHPLGLHSLAQSLRHVFPVHVGVDEDAVAILPFNGKSIEGRPVWGLMIVDLYPGGIGLIQAIDEEPALLVRLLELTRDWLGTCPCQDDDGCERCIQSPIARSAVADSVTMKLSRGDALGVLERILQP